jgi:hypothetical protein
VVGAERGAAGHARSSVEAEVFTTQCAAEASTSTPLAVAGGQRTFKIDLKKQVSRVPAPQARTNCLCWARKACSRRSPVLRESVRQEDGGDLAGTTTEEQFVDYDQAASVKVYLPGGQPPVCCDLVRLHTSGQCPFCLPIRVSVTVRSDMPDSSADTPTGGV